MNLRERLVKEMEKSGSIRIGELEPSCISLDVWFFCSALCELEIVLLNK